MAHHTPSYYMSLCDILIIRHELLFRLRAVLVERGLSMSELGRRIGVTAELVSATVRGKRHSPKVLDALRREGVPEQYLFDPQSNLTMEVL